MASGDYSLALTSLMRFYDYLMPTSRNAMHQYALLNLASFHYATGGLDSAALALRDAIRLARKESDNACLQECVSLLYRLTTESDGAAWPGLEVPKVQRDALPPRRLKKAPSPMDELWSIKAAVDLGEPIPVVFRRVYVALGQHNASAAPPNSEKNEQPQPQRSAASGQLNTPAWHFAQAGLWSLLGSDSLADLHETMALASPDLENETRMAVIYARAERAALKGQFDEALASLLDLATVQGLALPEYHVWARTVWAILEREARLRQDVDAQAIIDGLRPPPTSAARLGPGGPLRSHFDAAARAEPPTRGVVFAHGEVTDALRQARKMLDSNVPPHVALPRVLSALHLASGLGLWPLYRAGTVTLGEVLLAMESPGMAGKADAEVAGVWDALVASGDDEAVARGAYVRARAHAALALGDEDESPPDAQSAARALHYAHIASVHADAVGLRAVKRGAAALTAMVEELGGGVPDTGAWARADKDVPRLGDTVRRAGEVVRLVGVRVAEGWSTH
ncbi:hypothetical protein Q8F55_004262 [Vanrija albida]|uniref:Anaphase-promoting complex subunit 5 n=1 Tax=Vanrija albida TaxID=181172 RepID=A0ABR3Q6I7_9TREE